MNNDNVCIYIAVVLGSRGTFGSVTCPISVGQCWLEIVANNQCFPFTNILAFKLGKCNS